MFKAASATIAVLAATAHAALVNTTSTTTLEGGWSVAIDVTYDDTVRFPFALGKGQTNGIESLDVAFFNPAGNLEYAVNNISGGISTNQFLAFALDPEVGRPIGNTIIDIGAEEVGPGAFFLSGIIANTADIFGVAGAVDTTSNMIFIFPTLVESCYEIALDAGYRIEGTLTYDANLPVVSASGTGPTNGIESLEVNVFDPAGTLVFSVDDVEGGVSSYQFLSFEFDTTLQSLAPGSFFAIGEDTGTPGEHYLFGVEADIARLFRIEPDASRPQIDATAAATVAFTEKNAPLLAELCYEITLDAGYRVDGTLIYDANRSLVSARGSGPTDGIEFFDVNVTFPDGEPASAIINVENGVSSFTFFDFDFDTARQNLVPGSFFDIGQFASTGNDWNLRGSEGAGASLVVYLNDFVIPTVDGTSAAVFTFTDKSPPCNPADIDAPFGILDLGDVDTFITAFATSDPLADIADPLGVIDLADIDAFILAFLAGCP